MSKAARRKKAKRIAENLAAAQMVRALKGEEQRYLYLHVRARIDESRAVDLQRIQSAIRKWERETLSAELEDMRVTDRARP